MKIGKYIIKRVGEYWKPFRMVKMVCRGCEFFLGAAEVRIYHGKAYFGIGIFNQEPDETTSLAEYHIIKLSEELKGIKKL
jgi:hypothetical protein